MARSRRRPVQPRHGCTRDRARTGRIATMVRRVLGGLVAIAVVAGMVRLAVWQWDKARAGGALLNYSYAVEWLFFAGLVVLALARLLREGRRMARAPEPEHRSDEPLIGPPLEPGRELEEVTWVRVLRGLGLDRG
jgi:hypothetical protein